MRTPTLGILLLTSLLLGAAAARADDPPEPSLEYRTHSEVQVLLAGLVQTAQARGVPAEVVTYGRSHGGRALLALRLGRATPTVLVHGGLGDRDAAGTVACLDLAARVASGEAGADAASWLLIPAPNPDALDAFLAGRAPEGGGSVDRDRDGRRGEDGPSDVDGDGEILWMRKVVPEGTWAVADEGPTPEGKVRGDERLLEEKGVDGRRAASYRMWREGLDDDGDGEVNEDAPALDLTRQMTGFYEDKAPWSGDGPFPGYAPETHALMELTFNESALVAWYGFTGEGREILRASEAGQEANADDALYGRIAMALKGRTGLETRRASERRVGPVNPGSDLDWAAVHLGVPAFRIPVWRIPKQEANGRGGDAADEIDWLLWNDRVLHGEGFVRWRAFDHPTLGRVEIGGWNRFTRYEPPSELLAASVAAVSAAPLAHAAFVPSLVAHVEVTPRGGGLFEVALHVANTGGGPTDTRLAERQRRSVGVRARLAPKAGVRVVAGPAVADAGRLEEGAVADGGVWLLAGGTDGALATVQVRHPRAGVATAEVMAK